MAQLVGVSFPTPEVAGLIPGQDAYLGCGLDPLLEHKWEASNQCFFLTLMFSFLPLTPSTPSKSNEKFSSGEDKPFFLNK